VTTRLDRARGALLGLALGDALGMPTQELTRSRAEQLLGGGPAFLEGPADNTISAGMPAGSVTDDTEQALVMARLLVEGHGLVDPRRLAEALLDWEADMVARGSSDLLGPSTKRALAAVRAGADPATTGRTGTTNGAAMRIAPVGIATPWGDLDALVEAVAAASRVTHDTPDARAGAAAVAAVVSAGIDGVPFEDALPFAVEAARRGGSSATVPDVAARITEAVDLARGVARLGTSATASFRVTAALNAVAEQIGTSLATHESVPAAFAMAALSPRDAWHAGWLAARLGGDSDTIAAMAGAMIGASIGATGLPDGALAALLVDRKAVDDVAAGLLAVRDAARFEDRAS
jgi:ADP-ribosylglycohydrolase